MGKMIAIDLGTTNSCVSVMENGQPKVIENKNGQRTTPSVVAYGDDGVTVGDAAKRQAVTNPESTIIGVKRLIGRLSTDPEVKVMDANTAFDIVSGDNGDAQVQVGGKKYAPAQVSAEILMELKEQAETYLGEEVTEAVITVPAYFNDAQRQATKDAGKIAGLDVKRVINEPTAAALSYGLGTNKGDNTIAVYDLGGGTFDVSILDITDDGTFEVKSTNGNTFLGGENFDERIIAWMAEDFAKENGGIDLLANKTSKQRLKEEAEKAKKDLSASKEYEISLPFITANQSGPLHLNMKLTRAKLESLVADLIEATVGPMEQALKDAGLKTSDIDEIVMVGGMTRMPKVVETVENFFGKKPHTGVNADEVVASGAAIQAGVLQGDVKDVLLLDVTPLTLGIETLGGVMQIMIERNETIPTTKTLTFSTSEDNQTAVTVSVFQGERAMTADNKKLGEFNLDGIPPAPKGIPQIEVTFDINADGLVTVSAKDKTTGKEMNITIEADGGLSDEDIERMVKEAEENADSDKARREEVETRNQADALISMAEKNLEEYGESVPEEVVRALNEAIAKTQEAKDSGNTAEVVEATEKLTKAISGIGAAMAEAAAAKEAATNEATNDGEDNDGETAESTTTGAEDTTVTDELTEKPGEDEDNSNDDGPSTSGPAAPTPGGPS